MTNESLRINRRILVIDDNKAIHDDFAKILCRESASSPELAEVEAQLFGDVQAEEHGLYQIDSAFQGEQGLEMVEKARAEGKPYAMAFIDVRMPPGWDGIETAARIWKVDPTIQVVVCTAYSDYSWQQMLAKLGHSDRLIVLKKPFDTIEVLQLADTLTHKWQRADDGNRHLAALQRMIRDRTDELHRDHRLKINAGDLAMAAAAADTHVRQQLVLEHDLRDALEAGELTVHYQPLVDVATERIVSLEALVRWQHATKGWISPNLFIPVAEESGLILPLGEFVLRTACTQVVRWSRERIAVVPVAVNISAVQLQRQDIVEVIRGILRETGMSPHLLALELTESALMEDMQQHIVALQLLRRDGVGIEIDDFGTGYSSLSYLKQLPVDAVKIDRSFISEIDTNPVDTAIVSAIVAMAHSLQLRAVAEGVETAGQLQVLGLHRCDIAQGFLFSRPLPPAACGRLLAATTLRRSLTDPVRPLANQNEPPGGIDCPVAVVH
jgi:EAL domain-containing protein (putative c-di-GMP-specific phosphodiesterase class I)/DNA-binding LytR/AlgR family response regulator